MSRHLLVLIADDSAVVRVIVAKRVRAAGLEVVEYDSAASARAANATELSCALLDFDLGDGFGPDVAAHLRSHDRDLPIAFFTSTSTDPDVVKRASPYGPVFAKPEEIDAAVDWVSRSANK